MQFRVWHKLFLAFFATSLLLVAMTLLLTRYSFNRGFVDYLNTLDTNRSQAMIQALQQHHLTDPGWIKLAGNGRFWGDMLKQHWHDAQTLPPVRRSQRNTDSRQMSAPRRLKGGNRPPPPPHLDQEGRRGSNITLLDQNGEFVIGARGKRKYRLEIPIIENEQTIGTLLITRSRELAETNSDADNRFINQQQESLRWIALLATLFAITVSLLLSKILLKPLKSLSRATRKFADGDFESRVSVSSNDEFGTLINDFNEMATKLEKNRHERRQWTADISHELRTPLTILRGEIQALRDGIRPMDENSISSLDTEINRLNKLVDDLYDLSLADAGSMTYRKTPVDLRNIVNESTSLFKHEANELGLELIVKLPNSAVTVHADPDRLSQLINNLLKNSLRYTDAPGNIQVVLSSDQSSAILSVSDSTPNVSQEDLLNIFKRLYRADESRNRKNGGAGLGLSICKKIAEAHNGTLIAEQSELGGLKMIFKMSAK